MSGAIRWPSAAGPIEPDHPIRAYCEVCGWRQEHHIATVDAIRTARVHTEATGHRTVAIWLAYQYVDPQEVPDHD